MESVLILFVNKLLFVFGDPLRPNPTDEPTIRMKKRLKQL